MRPPWDESYWQRFETETHRLALRGESDAHAWAMITRRARIVLRAYSTSFFLVTRFLPAAKRAQVEAIYAAVRFPDEVVDSLPLRPSDQLYLLQQWEKDYDRSLSISSLQERLRQGIPPILAGFAQVVQEAGIPPEHYREFLQAMRLDVAPRPFSTMEDLVESYVYGSAIVVGYFLAYVYGPSAPDQWETALRSSRDLGIALQLTNFLRDVSEDQRRGRVYLPVELLQAEGISDLDVNNTSQLPPLRNVLQQMSASAEQHYSRAEKTLAAFSPDCQTAIGACINVYRQLNLRIGRSAEGVRHRESVPMRTKFQVLPPSKYWRVPLALMGAI